MSHRGTITQDISRLLDLFSPHCAERETFDWLRSAATDRGKWYKAHDVFGRIRRKSLQAERLKSERLAAQYLFEEICAKTLYNLSGASAPFDMDSPYWVIPSAIAFARKIGVADSEVLVCVKIVGGAP